MAEHLSQDLAERYRFRTMSKAELISADEHLASCRECREMLGNREDLRAQVNSLRANLEESLTAEHVGYEQLEAYVEGTLGAAEREAVDSHFKSCSLCSEELRDLQAFQSHAGEPASNSGFPETGRRNLVLSGLRAAWRPANRWAIAAGVVIALAIGIRVANKPSTIVHEPEGIATPVPATVNKPPETLGTGFSYLPSELQAVIATAIANQHLPAPIGPTMLAVQRGAEESSVALLTPVGTVVYGTTPVFLWEAVSKADGYRV